MVEGLRAARAAGETPRIAYSLVMNAYVHALRGDVDEADTLLEELRAMVRQSAETYHEGWVELIQVLLARARGNDVAATEALLERGRLAVDLLEPWGGNLLLLECVRSLVRDGRRDEAEPYRRRLAELSAISASSRAFLAWVDGLLATQPTDAQRSLGEAVDRFESLERRVERARCLIDLAEVERSMGEDPEPTLAHAMALLRTCGATLFLDEGDTAGPATERSGGGGPA
jgi:ATP/maltotriose-dependent transcriptional regulator MalT